jgi:hypothetical protein
MARAGYDPKEAVALWRGSLVSMEQDKHQNFYLPSLSSDNRSKKTETEYFPEPWLNTSVHPSTGWC